MYLCAAGNSKKMLQFILKKLLLLVFFLDRAKLTRLIDGDPCLFQASAYIKVNAYSSLLM